MSKDFEFDDNYSQDKKQRKIMKVWLSAHAGGGWRDGMISNQGQYYSTCTFINRP